MVHKYAHFFTIWQQFTSQFFDGWLVYANDFLLINFWRSNIWTENWGYCVLVEWIPIELKILGLKIKHFESNEKYLISSDSTLNSRTRLESCKYTQFIANKHVCKFRNYENKRHFHQTFTHFLCDISAVNMWKIKCIFISSIKTSTKQQRKINFTPWQNEGIPHFITSLCWPPAQA